MRKHYLFAPGPTSVPPEVLLELAKPVLHHREQEFLATLSEVREGLKYLFQTSGEVDHSVSLWNRCHGGRRGQSVLHW